MSAIDIEPTKTTKPSATKANIQPDWWSKTFAGCVLGASLALALSGLFAWLGPGGITADNKVQVNMWLISPLWVLIFSFVFLFRTGLRAILWLSLANFLAYGLLWIAQQGWLHGSGM